MLPPSCRPLGHSRSARAAIRMVRKTWICRMIEASPGGMPFAMPVNRSAYWPTKRVDPIATMRRHGTFGRGRKRTGSEARTKRNAASRIGGNETSATSIRTKLSPQMNATRIASAT